MTINIRQIRLVEIRLPLREPFQISSGTTTTRRIFLLELTDASGARAWSECVAGERPNYMPETIETTWLTIRDWLAPRVLGRDLEAATDVAPILAADVRGNYMAKAAVEMGAWGLEAEVRGEPLARLIGGERKKIGTGISLGIQESPAALLERAEAAVAAGYRKVKIKVKPGADLDYVRTVREALPEAPLMVDANNAYTERDFDHLKRFDGFGLIMIEQPLAWDDVVRHAGLQQQLTTPVCLDESITGRERARDMIELGSGRIVNIKPGRVGGFAESIAIHDLCRDHAVPVWCGGMLESGVGRAYNVALASLGNFSLPGDVSPSARYWERDVVDPEWTMDAEGMVTVPWERPGIGVEVDEKRIEELAVRSETLTA